MFLWFAKLNYNMKSFISSNKKHGDLILKLVANQWTVVVEPKLCPFSLISSRGYLDSVFKARYD